ncbi:MAG: Xaa-Pro peptidase family protein [Proteobacteria bacterium]|nr:Xaa-Pro peptidase family protein [Pseudomonadota bacterium]
MAAMATNASNPDGFGYPFTVEEFQGRLKKVRGDMRAAGIDILLVTGPENIYYLSGYRTTGYYIYQALVVPLDGDPQFVVRALEFTNVQALSWIKTGYKVEDTESYFEATAACIEKMGGAKARIGFDDGGFFLPASILDGLRARMTGAKFIPDGGLVEKSRVVKSPQEIDYIRRASACAVAGLEAGIAHTQAGVSENDLAGETYNALVRAGSEYTGSQPYVVTGKRSALGHATFERQIVQHGDDVFFEVGGCIYRYGGAIMRSVSVGPPSPAFQQAADAVLGALDAILNAAKPGATSGEVDRAGRSVVEKAGLGDHWHHRTGYSIGIGFPPGWGEGHIMDLKPNDTRRLEPGMAFHTVPLLLIPQIGSVGFSETFVITETGCEVLTETPRELRVAG